MRSSRGAAGGVARCSSSRTQGAARRVAPCSSCGAKCVGVSRAQINGFRKVASAHLPGQTIGASRAPNLAVHRVESRHALRVSQCRSGARDAGIVPHACLVRKQAKKAQMPSFVLPEAQRSKKKRDRSPLPMTSPPCVEGCEEGRGACDRVLGARVRPSWSSGRHSQESRVVMSTTSCVPRKTQFTAR